MGPDELMSEKFRIRKDAEWHHLKPRKGESV